MYYYIFEPPHEAKEYERTANIKELLSTLGIAGEMTTPTPGRTVEDLVNLAVAKRYSTVIAVGGVEFVNRVARALEPFDAVFGIIPFVEHPDISQLIGASDWKNAAESLKRRRFLPVRLGMINHEIAFITPATISIPPKCEYRLASRGFEARGKGGLITISPSRSIGLDEEPTLTVDIKADESGGKGVLARFLGRQPAAPANSLFHLTQLELHTDQALPIQVASTDLCSTPVLCQTQAKPLKLIITRSLP